jgi:uncharacterized membrane protein
MSILKELDELTKAEVVSTETADKIRDYYKSKQQHSGNKLFIVFGVLGAILVGLGIILIIAHNWDDLSKATKVFFAFMPLIAAQVFCGITLWKKNENAAWREASSAFLFFAVGASISLISQVYNIHGDLSKFLFTWMLLCFPFIYIMKSSMASLLYIAGISYYCWESDYHISWSFLKSESSYNYWWMLLLVLPYYYNLLKKKSDSNFTIFHNWFIPLSLTICLGSLAEHHTKVMYAGYMSLFGLFYLIGTSGLFADMKRRINGYLVIGSLGTMNILLTLSFDWFWKELRSEEHITKNYFNTPEFIAVAVLTVLAMAALVMQMKKGIENFHPVKIIFLLFILIFITGYSSPVLSISLINLLIFLTGIFTIRSGAKADHLGVLNYGLLTITALVVCRFFDSNMSFVLRGLLFVIVGIGFFLTNYLMLKKRKQNIDT